MLIRTGAATDAVAAARELVGAAPLRERPVELLMRALHACGRVADALEAYRQHRQLLADELGLDPPAGLRELEARILQDDLPGPARAELYRGAAPPRVRVALPGRPGAIIGREDDLAIVRRCLVDRPLVSLVGPGGVGKTRLALELAHEHAVEGRPIVWVDLSTVEEGRLADLVADATGVDMPRGQDPHRGPGRVASCVVRAAVPRQRRDRAGRGRAAGRGLARATRRGCESSPPAASGSPSTPSTCTGWRRWPCLPARTPTTPPSGSSSSARAGSRNRSTEAALEDIALLCRRLDGLPLAIELGAAQAPTFGIRQFSDHIAGELDLLAGGRRTAATRHRTLRAVVDASYGLLTPDEATLFVRLAVFPGPFRLREARLVCADDRLDASAVGPLLARLVEQSMVQSGAGRFWLLDTLRTYALPTHRRRRAPQAAWPACPRRGESGGRPALAAAA